MGELGGLHRGWHTLNRFFFKGLRLVRLVRKHMFNYMVPGDRRDGLPLVHTTIHNALVVAGEWYPAVAGI